MPKPPKAQAQVQSPQHEYYTNPRKQATSRGATKSYLRLKDKVEVMDKCGDAALILYEFYIAKSGQPGYSYSDQAASTSLGWKVSKVKPNRLRLKKYGYFHQQNGKLHNGSKITLTYLDPKEIRDIGRRDERVANTPDLPIELKKLISNLNNEGIDIEEEVDEL